MTATERDNAVNWESKDNLLGWSQTFRNPVLYCEGGEFCPWNKGTSTQHSLRLSHSNFPNSLQQNSIGFLSLEYLSLCDTFPEQTQRLQRLCKKEREQLSGYRESTQLYGSSLDTLKIVKVNNKVYPVTNLVKARHRKTICSKSLRNSRTVLKKEA